ncbi:hypothetical protein [Dactylosporangium sp. CA-139066]
MSTPLPAGAPSAAVLRLAEDNPGLLVDPGLAGRLGLDGPA